MQLNKETFISIESQSYWRIDLFVLFLPTFWLKTQGVEFRYTVPVQWFYFNRWFVLHLPDTIRGNERISSTRIVPISPVESHDLKISPRESIDESRCTRPRSRKCIEGQMKERWKRDKEREKERRATCCTDRLNIYPHVSPVTRVVTLQFFSKWRDVTRPGLYADTFYPSPFVHVERRWIGFYERAAAKAYHATRAAAWLNVVSL